MEHETYDLLKRYHSGQLSDAERAVFEKQMDTDAAFAAEVSAWAAIYKGIQAEGDRQLNRELEILGKKLMQSEEATLTPSAVNKAPKQRSQMPRWLYAAAAVLLLLLLAWPIYQHLKTPTAVYADNKALFEQHFRLPPAPQVRDAQVTAWRTAYQNKNYAAAIESLEQLLADPDYTNRSEANLFLGLSHLAAGRGQQALTAFGAVSPDSYDRDEAQWYAALAYLIIDDVVHAKQTLEEVSGKEGHPHRQEANELLNSMQ